MPEILDFPTIALRVITDLEAIAGTTAPDLAALPLSGITAVNSQTRQLMAVVAEQLRQVWNARGAADLATVLMVGHFAALVPEHVNGAQAIERAIHALDR